ncbi:hypothetical protein [Sutcliffiella horikoshii]|uniref:Uncharacterized protein n=1 Tax=Sutcliffiella horikoshii TaxID=79883 RepID=A0A5D4TE56_9BACI|nr:hypothetical protein [Sutcliffiella horikoshii]TYS72374.1 hypothetical protein FZC75_10490 [Sutcliffiella horikoshii]
MSIKHSTKITITRMQIGEFEVKVPVGLSELICSAGAWSEKQKNPLYLEDYQRYVEMRNGRVITVLKKK